MAHRLENEKERERKLEEKIEKLRQRIRKLEEEREWKRERVRKLEEEIELERENVRKLEEEREEEERARQKAVVLKVFAEVKERVFKEIKANAEANAEKERDRLERYKPFNGVSSQDHAQEAHFKRTQSYSGLSQGHGKSALEHKDRIMERQQRIAERAAKALAEKNQRDIMAQREQSDRDRIAEHLDPEVKRWSSGKEGNLRTLLSTLQYILGQNSGWQSIHLTEVSTAADVKKAYRKAMLYMHPDKLQQRGASIRQTYICKKVFHLLQEARIKFNSEMR